MPGSGPRPLFAAVSGPPASGKSTLAPPLARRLALPLVAKDTIKDALMSVLAAPDVTRSSRRSAAPIPGLRSGPMDRDTMRARVAAARVGRLATVTPAGEPHVVPCCFVLDGDTILSAVDAKPKSTLALRRLDNLRARPRAALLVDHYDDDWATLWWVRADGDGRVIDAGAERERALDLLAAKYRQYRIRRPPGAVLAVTVTRWRAWP